MVVWEVECTLRGCQYCQSLIGWSAVVPVADATSSHQNITYSYFTGHIFVALLLCTTEPRKSLGTWLREISSCSSLTFLPGPAWVLLSKICQDFFSALYIILPRPVALLQRRQSLGSICIFRKKEENMCISLTALAALPSKFKFSYIHPSIRPGCARRAHAHAHVVDAIDCFRIVGNWHFLCEANSAAAAAARAYGRGTPDRDWTLRVKVSTLLQGHPCPRASPVRRDGLPAGAASADVAFGRRAFNLLLAISSFYFNIPKQSLPPSIQPSSADLDYLENLPLSLSATLFSTRQHSSRSRRSPPSRACRLYFHSKPKPSRFHQVRPRPSASALHT